MRLNTTMQTNNTVTVPRKQVKYRLKIHLQIYEGFDAPTHKTQQFSHVEEPPGSGADVVGCEK